MSKQDREGSGRERENVNISTYPLSLHIHYYTSLHIHYITLSSYLEHYFYLDQMLFILFHRRDHVDMLIRQGKLHNVSLRIRVDKDTKCCFCDLENETVKSTGNCTKWCCSGAQLKLVLLGADSGFVAPLIHEVEKCPHRQLPQEKGE